MFVIYATIKNKQKKSKLPYAQQPCCSKEKNYHHDNF